MHALVLGPDGPAVTRDHALEPRSGEATVALRLGGVCGRRIRLQSVNES